ncbi:MAG TPA: Gfo/Idh/MocA family oxidoreductase [Planctomycetaceae bacterium]|nr:Gfo/Idh/MocA family oxidoreductase [Planctomycetaceae bacterium]
MTSRTQRDGVVGPSASGRTTAPRLPYRPRGPKRYRPRIALIACGGITKHHLRAYRQAGYDVVALCDTVLSRARKRKQDFYPEARVYRDWRRVIQREDIDVVDLAAHPEQRLPMIEAALEAGKHVLSQKPFVLDLDVGRRLVELADRHGVKLAVNQNARWAPHFRYMWLAVEAGLVGDVTSVHFTVHWDHNIVRGTAFEKIHHLVLYDFGIHWFDMLTCLMGRRRPKRVYASAERTAGQQVAPPLLAQAVVEYDGAQASVVFDGDTRFAPQDRSWVSGPRGTLLSVGPDWNHQRLSLTTADGTASPRLRGHWFPDGFLGTMAELLAAIEEDRPPLNNARQNLESLALCFAAAASADRHEPVVPGAVRRLP